MNLRNMPIANPCFAFVKVNVLDEDTVVMNLEFSVQETTCLRDSGDPSSCTFRRGYYVVSDPGSNVRETLTTSMTRSGSGVTKGAWPLPVWHSATHWVATAFPAMDCVLRAWGSERLSLEPAVLVILVSSLTSTAPASYSLRSRCNLLYVLYSHTVRTLCIRQCSDPKRPTAERSPSTSETLLDMDVRQWASLWCAVHDWVLPTVCLPFSFSSHGLFMSMFPVTRIISCCVVEPSLIRMKPSVQTQNISVKWVTSWDPLIGRELFHYLSHKLQWDSVL